MNIEIEQMSAEFTKYHLQGLPFGAVIHRFTDPDKGSPHDHPFGFTSFILSGGYVERVYRVRSDGSWTTELIERLPGTVHTIDAAHIHQIVELPFGECFTLILPREKIRESKFWQFEAGGAGSRSRYWYEGDFI